ncbi:MAG: hypothetical protein R2865_00325 [Deinococcales bacterium]
MAVLKRDNPISSSTLNRWMLPLLSILVTIMLVNWGGLPREGIVLFWLGVASIIVMLGLGIFALHKVLQMPAHYITTAKERMALGFVLTLGGVLTMIGGYWDEVWHVKYGLPFGEDLLWRPHQIIYLGLLSISLSAVWAAFKLYRSAKGSLWQRLVSDRALAIIVLLGAFMAYSVPMDPLWHTLYGADISAWSVPHLLLVLCVFLIMLTAIVTLLSALPKRTWQLISSLQLVDMLLILAFAISLSLSLQVFTTEWDATNVIREGSAQAFWQRPEWLLPGVLAFLGIFYAITINQLTRCVGSASLTILLALALRQSLVTGFAYDRLSADMWLLLLAPMMAVDLSYAIYLLRNKEQPQLPMAWLSGLAGSLGLGVISLCLMPRLLIYPRINSSTIPMMLLAIVLGGLYAAYLGKSLGTAGLEVAQKSSNRDSAKANSLWFMTALVISLVFLLFYIVTASPPTHTFGIEG